MEPMPWSLEIFSNAARSSIVRATFKIRSQARAQIQIRHRVLEQLLCRRV
jgi:hypothetical protein